MGTVGAIDGERWEIQHDPGTEMVELLNLGDVPVVLRGDDALLGVLVLPGDRQRFKVPEGRGVIRIRTWDREAVAPETVRIQILPVADPAGD